jgi:hypothetical protein
MRCAEQGQYLFSFTLRYTVDGCIAAFLPRQPALFRKEHQQTYHGHLLGRGTVYGYSRYQPSYHYRFQARMISYEVSYWRANCVIDGYEPLS